MAALVEAVESIVEGGGERAQAEAAGEAVSRILSALRPGRQAS
jgi:ribosomal protein S9